MKISEILNSSEDLVKAKIGSGPYLYYSGIDIIVDCSLESIIKKYVHDGQIVDDIEIFAYGFKKDEDDTHQYINPDDLKKRFEDMEHENIYEIVTLEEDDGKTQYVIENCDFDVISYYFFDCNRSDLIVNCKPIQTVIQEGMEKRVKKSDNIRR